MPRLLPKNPNRLSVIFSAVLCDVRSLLSVAQFHVRTPDLATFLVPNIFSVVHFTIQSLFLVVVVVVVFHVNLLAAV